MGFRYDIQGLRAIAVLVVFIFHLFPNVMPGGFIGVDVFFVISGYLISSIILKNKENNTFNFIEFYLGRLKRIVPIYYIVVSIVLLSGSAIFYFRDLVALKRDVVFASIFYSNVELAKANDYFGQLALENPLLHTWTLSLEMQFYLLLPFFIYLLPRKNIFKATLLLSIILFSYSFYGSSVSAVSSQMYFSLWARIPEFLVGMLFAIGKYNFIKIPNIIRTGLSWISLLGIFCCALWFNETLVFPGLWVLLPCIFTGILLMGSSEFIQSFLSSKILVHIGMLSYSIYLWHWPIMAFIRYYYQEPVFSALQAVIICLATYALSWGSYVIVEQKWRVLRTPYFVGYSGLLAVVLLSIYFGANKMNERVLNVPAYIEGTPFGDSSHGSKFVDIQLLGTASHNLGKVSLIGDSHAKSYRMFFDVIGKHNDFSIQAISFNALPLIEGFSRQDFSTKRDYINYKEMLPHAQALIDQSDIILFSSAFLDVNNSLRINFKAFVEALKPNQKLVIVEDYPIGKVNYLKKNRSYVHSNYANDLQGHLLPSYVQHALDTDPQVFLLDIDYQNASLPYINDTLSYYDPTHLNDYGSQKLGEKYNQAVFEQLLKIQATSVDKK